VPNPKTADTAFPTGRDVDLVDLLLTQHARIEELFTLVAGSTGDLRREAFEELVNMLTIHEAAEEELVHPLARDVVPGPDGEPGNAVIDDRLEEERQAKEMLQQLGNTDPDTEGFTTTLLLLRNAVLTHARHEERYEFPYLRANVSKTRLRALAKAVRDTQAAAPTRRASSST
jgi:hypothetical protein